MNRRIRSLASAAAVAAAFLLAAPHGATQQPAKAAAKSDQSDDLERYLCKDVMRMTGEDRIIATAILHGYTLGKKSTTKYVPADLSKVTDSFLEHCLSNPNEKALQAFTKLAK